MERASTLEIALQHVLECLTAGQPLEALQCADRARRLAPDDLTLLLLQANLLLAQGQASEAASLLVHRQGPEFDAARAEAGCLLGAVEESLSCCRGLLRRYAVDDVGNVASLAKRLVRLPERDCVGWLGLDSTLRLVGEVRSLAQLRVSLGSRDVPVVIAAAQADGWTAFASASPLHGADLISAEAEGRALIGSGLVFPPDFGLYGWTAVRDQALIAEARLDWAPSLRLPVIIRSSRATPSTKTLTLAGAPSADALAAATYAVALDELAPLGELLDVFAQLPDGRLAPLTGSPLDLTSCLPYEADGAAAAPIARTPAQRPNLDIVIPVYAGLTETLDCLHSVLACLPREWAEIVVVDDASPEFGLRRRLTELAQEGALTLLINETNLGFPGAVNRGMRLHPERDVVLLNADTEVFGDWLERLRTAAYSADDIGTATPLGDCASIASYPGQGVSCSLAEADTASRITGIVNDGVTVDVPVGVGFCLYIKRDCLDAVGEFDERRFGRGYGEENDFCFRASAAAWRHVVAADVFVRHRGGRSFGADKDLLMARHRHVLNSRHPGYESAVEEFIAADPLREARRAIDVRRLTEFARAPVLLATLEWPGGVARHVERRRHELEAAGQTVLELRPATGGGHERRVQLHVPRLPLHNLVFDLPEELDSLGTVLRELPLSHLEIHHFLGLPTEALELILGLGVAYLVFVHDYAWICPRLNLLGSEGRYCGEPEVRACGACVRRNGSAMDEALSVPQLRARSAGILARADGVIVPTQDTCERLLRHFPDLRPEVQPWETLPAPTRPAHVVSDAARRRVRVALIGAIGLHKGYKVLLDCALDAAARALPLEFVIIGHTHEDQPLLATGRVSITGPYREDEVAALLDRERCDLAWFPSVTPETWCYALSHALLCGLGVVAFDLGAIAERLRAWGQDATLLPLSTPAAAINNVLLRRAGWPLTASALETMVPENHTWTSKQLRQSPVIRKQNLPLPLKF